MLTPAERRLERSRMSTALVNLETFAVFWSPRFRRLLCRSTVVRRRFQLPPDAVRVGVYARPATAAEILADLDELLESRTQEAQLQTSARSIREVHDD